MKQQLRVRDLAQSIEADGMSGFVRAVARMVDPNGPSAECIQAADEGMSSAANAEQFWEAAVEMAACLREAKLAPPEPEVPGPEEPEEPDDPGPIRDPRLGDLALAALLGHLRRGSK